MTAAAAWPTSRGLAMQQHRKELGAPSRPPRSSSSSNTTTVRSSAIAAPARCRRTVLVAAASASAAVTSPSAPQLLAELDALLARTTPPSLVGAADPQLLATSDAAEDAAVALVLRHRGGTSGGNAATPTPTPTFASFGRARMLPKRDYTIDELRLNKIEPEKLLSPRDASLIAVRNGAQVAALAGFAAAAAANHWDPSQALFALVAATFAFGVDAVALNGAAEALAVDALGRAFLPEKYARRVALHEASHFLIAYLVGLMPRGYVLSSWAAVVEAVRAQQRGGAGSGGGGAGAGSKTPPLLLTASLAAATQAGTSFCDASFRREVQSGKLSGASLDRYTAAALAGVVAEYLSFGQAEGGVGDVAQLDALFNALGFSQRKAAAQVRWAVLSVAALLRRHGRAHASLADAMERGATVGECVAVLERELAADVARDPKALLSLEEDEQEGEEEEAAAAAAATAEPLGG
jgi:hypothetical protein